MIELVITVCLAQDVGVCSNHLLPNAAPTTQPQCEAAAEARIEQWQVNHPDLVMTDWSCKTPDIQPLSVTEIAAGIWVHKGLHDVPTPQNAGDLANISFVVGTDAVAVIDAGGSRDVAEGMWMAIRQVTDLPVKWLVLTHMHPDHVMGASLYWDADVQIITHDNFPSALASRAMTYDANFDVLIGSERMVLSKVVPTDNIKTGVANIDLGGRKLTFIETVTAHTDNDLRVFDDNSRTIWMGDLVFAEHTPALDGSITGWLGVLDEMKSFGADGMVPGHGPVRLSWPDGMDATYGYLSVIAEETRDAISQGESLGKAITHVGESQRESWELFDEFNARNATTAYTELEWE